MKKFIPIVILGLVLIAAGIFVLLAFSDTSAAAPQETPDLSSFVSETPAPVPTPEISSAEIETETETVQEEYISPIDFEGLWAYNSDIYAWLSIPGTNIAYPIAQNAEDGDYYLDHDWVQQYSADGTLFTESLYNNTDFSDPVTVVYGHNMKDGDMFGNLRGIYSDDSCFDNYDEIIVYLPDREIHFDVFAAVPFDDRHILYNYDFTDDWVKNSFFYHILSLRTLDTHIDPSFSVGGDGQYLILSTCAYVNGSRFLVMGQVNDSLQQGG